MAGLSSEGGSGGAAGSVRAGKAFVELSARDSGVFKAIDRLKAKLGSLGNFLVKVGTVTAGVGASVLAAFRPASQAPGDQSQLLGFASALGFSAESASRLFGILKAGGSDIRDAAEGLATFEQRIQDAIAGTGEAGKLFELLRVSAQEFAAIKDPAERFYKLLDAVKKSTAPISKLNLLMKAVGEDTGKNMAGVIKLSADQIRRLGDASEQSAADLEAASQATIEYTIATAKIQQVWREVVAAIAPLIKQLAELVTKNVDPLIQFVRQNRDAVKTLALVAFGAVATGAALVALGLAIKGVIALYALLGTTASATYAIITARLRWARSPGRASSC